MSKAPTSNADGRTTTSRPCYQQLLRVTPSAVRFQAAEAFQKKALGQGWDWTCQKTIAIYHVELGCVDSLIQQQLHAAV